MRIREKRKLKLKELSKQAGADRGQSKKLQDLCGKPRIKDSKSTGEAPLAVDARKSASGTVKCSSKPTNKQSSSTSRSTLLSKNGLSVSSDPRLKNSVNRVNCSSSTSLLPDARIENKSVPNIDYLNSYKRSTFGNKPNAVSSFDNILSILSWRTQWLEEQKKCTTYPPVNKRPAIKMCNSFANYTDYINVVTPLLMIELWNEIFVDWISIDTPEKYVLH